MIVYGFTFIRNAIKYDYPIIEAITSILPICDKVVVALGKSDDATSQLLRSLDTSKIEILQTTWNDTLRKGGRVLAIETDKAFQKIASNADWAFYIQGDEVVHEKYLPGIKTAMYENLKNPAVDGLLFKYLHFYGSYDFVGASSNWYKHEIRIIRNDKSIYSYHDAQGFRKAGEKKLCVKELDAYIYHYGWVREPKSMQLKQETFNKYWHDDNWMKHNVSNADVFDYEQNINQLEKFAGTHPKVMQARIDKLNWHFEYDISFNKASFKDRLKDFISQHFNINIGYKNYIKI